MVSASHWTILKWEIPPEITNGHLCTLFYIQIAPCYYFQQEMYIITVRVFGNNLFPGSSDYYALSLCTVLHICHLTCPVLHYTLPTEYTSICTHFCSVYSELNSCVGLVQVMGHVMRNKHACNTNCSVHVFMSTRNTIGSAPDIIWWFMVNVCMWCLPTKLKWCVATIDINVESKENSDGRTHCLQLANPRCEALLPLLLNP